MSLVSNLFKRKAVNSKKYDDSLIQAVKNLDDQKVCKMLSKGAYSSVIEHPSPI